MPSPYPIRNEFEKELEPLDIPADLKNLAVEVVGEYEHGTAAVEDVEGITLSQYKAVLLDFLLTLSTTK